MSLFLASGGVEPIWGVHPVVWHLINFTIFATILAIGLKKGLLPMLQSERKTLETDIEEASQLRSEMEGKFREYEERLKSIDAQVEKVLADAKVDAEAERERLIKEAKEMAGRMRQDAKAIAEQELQTARRLLLAETMALASEGAVTALRAEITDDDQARLAEEFIRRVGEAR